MADVTPRPVQWLWHDRVATGRLSLLVGQPGVGKSYLTADMAARISTGRPWPDGSPCERGSVLLLSAEDDPADTLRPRLDAHDADVSRVVAMTGSYFDNADPDDADMTVTLADVAMIEDALRELDNCRLIVVDPIGSYLGGRTDAHRDNEVRSVLAPIAKLAEKYGPAVLCVAHRRKSAGRAADDMALGSRAFTGIARSVWHLSVDTDDDSRRLLLPGKNNLAPRQHGLAYRITGNPGVLQWDPKPVTMSADDALAKENDGQDAGQSAHDEAKAWLADYLVTGPRPAKEIKQDAKRDGIAERTVDRAAKSLNVDRGRDGLTGPWVWRLPEDPQVLAKEPSTRQENPLACTRNVGEYTETADRVRMQI
ncbi:AAA family ATPase [Roseimaritima sediminicola]|uniref:AAA family ATPase n=1 Tax=Roseimaritima sediminicola TaxID=2662066 RepID=UPI001386C802|nr:AAA family ATPase [Roseimaritima sediminicola]